MTPAFCCLFFVGIFFVGIDSFAVNAVVNVVYFWPRRSSGWLPGAPRA